LRTAATSAKPERALRVAADCWQHLVSARKIRSGFALIRASALSCGYPPPAGSAASATFTIPSSRYTEPMKVFDVAVYRSGVSSW
jgi:hypothetical protein